jgi:acetoin utilization deacetylase AcuC-like enzyme
VRNNRRSYILYKQIPPPEHRESIKRYSQILSKQKQKQGGLDSFWIFKKEAATEEKKTRAKNNQVQEKSSEISTENKLEQAFCRVLLWGKLAADIECKLPLTQPA